MESEAQTMYKIENRWPIRAFVPKIAIPRSRYGGLGLVVWSDWNIFLTSFVDSGAQTLSPRSGDTRFLASEGLGRGGWGEKFFWPHFLKLPVLLYPTVKTAARYDPAFRRYRRSNMAVGAWNERFLSKFDCLYLANAGTYWSADYTVR